MNEQIIKALVNERLQDFSAQLEKALALSMQKALDVVVADLDARLRALEEDQARILRHLGM